MADEDFKDTPEEEVSPSKKKGLPVIVIVIAGVLLGVGGFFAGTVFSGGDKTDDQPAKQEVKKEQNAKVDETKKSEKNGENKTDEAKKETGSEQGAESSGTTESSDLEKPGALILDPFTVNLDDPFARRYAEVVVTLEVDKKSHVTTIKENALLIPKIRDEIFMIISSKSYRDLKSTAGKITLKEEILMRVNEQLKAAIDMEPVTNVYFTKFLMQ